MKKNVFKLITFAKLIFKIQFSQFIYLDAPEINESAAMTSEFVTARSLFLSEPAEKVSGSIKSSKFVYKKPHE